MYKTKNKKALLDFLEKNSKEMLSINEIEEKLKKEKIIIPKASLYRNILKLEDKNMLLINLRENGEKEYQLIKSECKSHIHFNCVKCKKLFHIDCKEMDEVKNHIKDEHGFFMDSMKTIISGICEDCLKKERKD